MQKDNYQNEDIWKPKKNIKEESMKQGIIEFWKALKHLAIGSKHIFLKSFKINLLILIILILATNIPTYMITKNGNLEQYENKINNNSLEESIGLSAATGNVIATSPKIKEQEPILPTDKINETKIDNNSQDTKEKDDTPKADEIFFRCDNGVLVPTEKDCEKFLPEVNKEAYAAKDSFTISLDGITTKTNDDNTGFIKYINFTLINRGTKKITPKVEVKTYEKWDSDAIKDYPDKTFEIDKTLGASDWISINGRTNIYYDDPDKTVRLEVIDIVENKEIVVLTVPLIS